MIGMASVSFGENSSVIAANGSFGSKVDVAIWECLYTKTMFFRRDRPRIVSFADRVSTLQQASFATQREPDGRFRILKHGVAAVIGDEGKNQPEIEKAGVVIGGQIAILVAGGYQEFLELPNGRRFPASSEQLKNLHEFEEDVKDALGLTSLYNTSLGTTSRKHDYDRVFNRDIGQQPKPWEKKQNRMVAPHTKDSLDPSVK